VAEIGPDDGEGSLKKIGPYTPNYIVAPPRRLKYRVFHDFRV
jgi:hypothetical protein